VTVLNFCCGTIADVLCTVDAGTCCEEESVEGASKDIRGWWNADEVGTYGTGGAVLLGRVG